MTVYRVGVSHVEPSLADETSQHARPHAKQIAGAGGLLRRRVRAKLAVAAEEGLFF